MPEGAVAQRPQQSSVNNLAPSNSYMTEPSTNSVAPEPIKVMRPKKKTTGKKKTVIAADTPSP